MRRERERERGMRVHIKRVRKRTDQVKNFMVRSIH